MTQRVLRALALGVSVAITGASGCSGSTSSGAGYGSVSYSQFPGAFAQAVCANIGSCCTSSGLPFNAGTCVERMVAAYQSDSDGVDPASYDEGASGPCLSAAAAGARECTLDTVVGSSGACGMFFHAPEVHGTLGEPCNGTCTLEGAGEWCTSIAYAPNGSEPSPVRCFTNDGVFCNDSGVCEQLIAVGQSCSTGYCDAAGWCNDSYVCEARQPEGGGCTNGQQCESGLYCPAAYGVTECPPAGGLCTTTFGPPYCAALKPDGVACDDFTQCSTGSCSSGVCGGPSEKLLSFVCVN